MTDFLCKVESITQSSGNKTLRFENTKSFNTFLNYKISLERYWYSSSSSVASILRNASLITFQTPILLKVNKINLSEKCEMETSSVGPYFPGPPWHPAAPALTGARSATYLWRPFTVWSSSATVHLLPFFLLSRIVKLYATPWTSMSFYTFLPLPTLILARIPFWKLWTTPIRFSWSGSNISPWTLPLSALLQGKVVHSFF